MNHGSNSAALDAMSRLCDSLTVALCYVESSNKTEFGRENQDRLSKAASAIQKAGSIVWDIQKISTSNIDLPEEKIMYLSSI